MLCALLRTGEKDHEPWGMMALNAITARNGSGTAHRVVNHLRRLGNALQLGSSQRTFRGEFRRFESLQFVAETAAGRQINRSDFLGDTHASPDIFQRLL